MAGTIIIPLCKYKKTFQASFLSENPFIITHVDEARKAHLHASKRRTIRPAIYEKSV